MENATSKNVSCFWTNTRIYDDITLEFLFGANFHLLKYH